MRLSGSSLTPTKNHKDNKTIEQEAGNPRLLLDCYNVLWSILKWENTASQEAIDLCKFFVCM